jgi:hypothetical protein
MPITYHEQGRYRNLPFVRALFATNFVFAIATLVAWQWAFLYLLGPLTWAADRPVPYDRNLQHIFEYPLILFWLGPAVVMAIAWTLIQARHYRAAFGLLLLPLLVAFVALIMYLVVPGAGA